LHEEPLLPLTLPGQHEVGYAINVQTGDVECRYSVIDSNRYTQRATCIVRSIQPYPLCLRAVRQGYGDPEMLDGLHLTAILIAQRDIVIHHVHDECAMRRLVEPGVHPQAFQRVVRRLEHPYRPAKMLFSSGDDLRCR